MIMLMKDFMIIVIKLDLLKDEEYQRYQTKNEKGIYDEIERLSTIRFTPKR